MNPFAHLTEIDIIVIAYTAIALAVGATLGALAVLLGRDPRPDPYGSEFGEVTRDPRGDA